MKRTFCKNTTMEKLTAYCQENKLIFNFKQYNSDINLDLVFNIDWVKS